MPDPKTVYNSDPTAGSAVSDEYHIPAVKTDSNQVETNVGLNSAQFSSIVSERTGIESIDERVSALETGTPVDPPNPVFIMTLGTETLVANIANVDGTYDSWQLVEGDDTEPVAGDGSWTTGTAVPSAYTIDSSWTASTLQPKTFWLWTLHNLVVTGYPSQTVTATTTRTVPQTPNDVTFNDLTDIQANSFIVSNTVGISGLLAPTAITISGGSYSKNGSDTWTSTAGVIENNDTIRLRQTSSANDSTLTTCTVQLGLREETWNITTAASGVSAGVISIVSATYAADEDAGPITVTLRVTGKTGDVDVGCRVATLYEPSYHTAVEDVNYVGQTQTVVQWDGTDTADKTVDIVLYDNNEVYNKVGELIITSGSEFGGATIDADNDATLFKINGTGGSATPSWQQQGATDYIVKVQAESTNNTIVPTTHEAGGEWVVTTKDSRSCLYSQTGYASAVIPGYSSTNPYVIMPVNFTQTGLHYVHLSCLGTYSTPDVLVHINTTESSSKFSYPTNGAWSWQDSGGYTVNVPSTGVHELKIFITDESVYVDAVILTTNASYDSVTNGDGESDSTWSTGTSGDDPDNPTIPLGPPPVVEDKTPDPFPFSQIANAPTGTVVYSAVQTITGINVPTSIFTTGGSGTVSIDGGSYVSSGNIVNGQTIQVKLTSSGSNSTTVSTVVTIGTVSHTFSVTTVAGGSVSLTPVTSTITVSANGTTVEDKDITIGSGGGNGIVINPGVSGTIIQNCRISSVDGHAIYGTSILDVEVANCEIADCWGSGIYLYGFTDADIHDNNFENVHSGPDLWNSSGTITIQDNWIKNVFLRINVQGKETVASTVGTGIALRYISSPNILIDNNIIINEQGNCDVEDKISMWVCSGRAAGPLTIQNNKMKGKSDSTSDAAINVGDGGGSYCLVQDNISYNAGQSGMGYVSGHDHTLRRNKILCFPLYKLTDPSIGTTNVAISPGYTAYVKNEPAPYNVVFEDNDVTFWKAKNFNNSGNTSEELTPYYFVNTTYHGPEDIGGWSTNRFDTPTSQPARLTEADVWNSAWDVRPSRITAP